MLLDIDTCSRPWCGENNFGKYALSLYARFLPNYVCEIAVKTIGFISEIY